MARMFINGNEVENVGIMNIGNIVKPTFTETQLIDNSSKANSFTFGTDYHEYSLLRIEYTNTSDNTVSSIIVTPNTLDAIFSKVTYLTINEFNNTNYISYRQSTLTWTKSSSAHLVVTAVYGMRCNLTLSETTIYQASGASSNVVTVTSVDKLTNYDWIMLVGNSADTTEIIPNITIMSPINVGDVAILQTYNSYGIFTLDSEYTLTGGKYFRVCGIKFT